MKVVCWNFYLEVGFFGPDFSILVQSCSFRSVWLFTVLPLVSAQHMAVMKENPILWSICQQGWIKGRVCWLRVGRFPCPVENLGRVSASEEKESLWWTVLSNLWIRYYWTLKAQQMTQGCADAFQLVTHPEPLRGKYLLCPVMGAVIFTTQVRAGVKQGEFFWDKSWISYNTQAAQVLSLAMCIFKMLADGDL